MKEEFIRIQRVKRDEAKREVKESHAFSKVKIKRGLIEDEYKKSVMVDFANKNIGGGVLNNGAVQEEILFCIFP